jgi:hypothetical protein
MHQTSIGVTTLLAWLVTAASGSACSSSTLAARVEEPGPRARPREILTAFVCDEKRADTDEEKRQEREARALALGLTLAVDHVRLVRHASDTDQELFAARGEACARAEDGPACAAELARLEAVGRTKKQVFAVTTAGDELKLYEGRAVLSLLGTIDNAEKAWTALMIAHNASSYLCNEPDWNSYRETASGYDLAWVWTERICRPFERVQAVDHVDRAGTVTRLRTHVVEHDAEACLVAR